MNPNNKKEVATKKTPKAKPNSVRRKLGVLEGKGKVIFGADFNITEEEFLGR